MVGVEEGEVEATYDDVLHGGCGEQPEEELVASMVGGRVLAGLVPKKSSGCVEHSNYSKVVGKGEGVVGMGEGKEVDRVVGREVGVEHSMVVGMTVRISLDRLGHISSILGLT